MELLVGATNEMECSIGNRVRPTPQFIYFRNWGRTCLTNEEVSVGSMKWEIILKINCAVNLMFSLLWQRVYVNYCMTANEKQIF